VAVGCHPNVLTFCIYQHTTVLKLDRWFQ